MPDVLAGAPQGVHGIRKIERDARGRGDREIWRDASERLLGGDAYDDLSALLFDVEPLNAVRLGKGKAHPPEPQQERIESG